MVSFAVQKQCLFLSFYILEILTMNLYNIFLAENQILETHSLSSSTHVHTSDLGVYLCLLQTVFLGHTALALLPSPGVLPPSASLGSSGASFSAQA